MLSAEERREIEAEVARSHDRRAAIGDALIIVQRHRGWVSDEAVADVAEILQLSPDEVDGIATFYSLIYRRPVGRHVILLCDSVSCWIMGYNPLREQLKERLGIGLGETTADGRFTLLPVACLGTCEQAPVMRIDSDMHGNLTPEKMDEILRRYP